MRRAGRRYESTAASKAQQGLSKVTSAAGPAISGAARGVGNALSKVGGRTGRLIGFIQGTLSSPGVRSIGAATGASRHPIDALAAFTDFI